MSGKLKKSKLSTKIDCKNVFNSVDHRQISWSRGVKCCMHGHGGRRTNRANGAKFRDTAAAA